MFQLRRVIIVPLMVFSVLASLSVLPVRSQDNPSTDAEKLAVKAGVVVLEGIRYPVFTAVKEVEKSQHGGITYTITSKNHGAAMALANRVRTFYQGKKIGAFTVPPFKKVSKPDTIAWSASKGTDEKGILVCVKVEEVTLTVYVIPSGSEGNLALIL